MDVKKNGDITHCKIKNSEIKDIRILYSSDKKTIEQWYTETKADVIINASLFEKYKLGYKPIESFIFNGDVVSKSEWCNEGFGINFDKTVKFGSTTPYWKDFTSAFPILVKDSIKNINFKVSSDLLARNPRSIFSQTLDGIMLTTVDGRDSVDGKILNRPGMTIDELPPMLIKEGAINSANMDGGGSTRMAVNGLPINIPCEDRGVPVIIAIWLNKEKGDEPKMKIIENFITNPINRPKTKIKQLRGLVIHWIGACQTSANVIRNNMQNATVAGAAQFIIDYNSGDIIQTMPSDEITWHCGGTSYTKTKEKICGIETPNNFLVGIECCIGDKTIPSDYQSAKYMELGKPSEIQYKMLVEFCADFCKKKRLIPSYDLYLHWDITGKSCHTWFVHDLNRWTKFKQDVTTKMNEGNSIPIVPKPEITPPIAPITPTPITEWYRIRKNWNDGKWDSTQLGSYPAYDIAKTQYKDEYITQGYKIFSPTGEVLFPVEVKYDPTINNMVADGVTKDPLYWQNVITGKQVPNADYIKSVLDKYHELIIKK